MFVEQAQRLQELAQRKRLLQQNLQQAKGFQGRQNLIDEELRQLQPITQGYFLLRSHGLVSFEIAERAETAAKVLTQIRQQFRTDPTWILSTSFDPKPLKSTLQTIRNTLNRGLQQAWKNHVAEQKVIVDEETLRLFEAIPAFTSATTRVRHAILQLSKISYPTTEEELQAGKRLIDECNTAWGTLHSDDVPTSVLEFLRAVASSGGAPLDAFTDEVASWLEANGIVRLFRIQLSG